jgi:hypothetical protein
VVAWGGIEKPAATRTDIHFRASFIFPGYTLGYTEAAAWHPYRGKTALNLAPLSLEKSGIEPQTIAVGTSSLTPNGIEP